MKYTVLIIGLALGLGASAVRAGDAVRSVANGPRGSLSFAKAITIKSPAIYPFSIAAGDLNNDGFPDLGVVGQNPQNLLHALGDGTGHFGHWSHDGRVGGSPGNALFADVDSDGNLDAVTMDGGAADVVVAFGHGTGHFKNSVKLPIGVGFASNQAVVVDLNGDGIPDSVGTADTGTDPGKIFVLLGKGNRKFGKAINFDSGGIYPGAIVVGDLNHDGIPDLLVANYGTEQNGNYGNVAVLLGKGDGTFDKPVPYRAGKDPYQLVLGDFSGDNNLDIAVVGPTVLGRRHVARVLLGNGDGTFGKATAYPSGLFPYFIVAADFNGDGILDLAVTNITNPKPCHVSVLLGNGDGTFRPPVQFRVGGGPSQLVVADFNHDGKPDIATINGTSTISILLNTTQFPVPPHAH